MLLGQTRLFRKNREIVQVNASPDLLYRQIEEYNKFVESHRFNTCFLTDKQLSDFLEDAGIWNDSLEKRTETLLKEIENLKLEAFQSCLNIGKRQKCKDGIKTRLKELGELTLKKSSFDHLGLSHQAEIFSKEWLLRQTVFVDGILITDVDSIAFKNIATLILLEQCNTEQIREIARTEPWSGLWRIKGVKVFDDPLNEEQISLILYSQMYDNIRQSPECPSDDVLNDDDLLDGWIIYQRKRSEERKKNESVENIGEIASRHGDSSEIFVMANNKEEASHINSLNGPTEKAIKKMRQKIIEQKGRATDLDFPDVKQELEMQKNNNFRDTVKGIR